MRIPRQLAIWARILLPVYLLVVGFIAFSPSDDSGSGFLDWLADALGEPGYVAVEFTANILMFVPFGVLVRLASVRLQWWMILALGFLTTVTIELTQLALPSRYSTVSDVIANTLGTAVGLAALKLLGIHEGRHRLRGVQTQSP
jgi:glycopeptide antibiotics resistance protein